MFHCSCDQPVAQQALGKSLSNPNLHLHVLFRDRKLQRRSVVRKKTG